VRIPILYAESFSKKELNLLLRLDSPLKVQEFLNRLDYSTEDIYRCPKRVLADRRAHCFDGAILAAAILRLQGYPPLIMDMLPNERDDEHLLALYRLDEHWGAVGKSNFTGLRFREPVYRTLRELMLSYFESFFNSKGEKTLRAYTVPLNLKLFDHLYWLKRDEAMDVIAEKTDTIRRYSLISPRLALRLSKVDERSLQAGLLGADKAGLFKL